MNNTQKTQLIVALDVNTLEEVRTIIEQLADTVNVYKVGSQLFTSCGPAAVRFLEARQKKVFLDLKYHDIPNTVANSVDIAVQLSVAIGRSMAYYEDEPPQAQSLYMYTLHTSGGYDMLKAAVEAGSKAADKIGVEKPLAVGVTVLTSEQKKDNILDLVLERAHLAKRAGLDGVVSSCLEAQAIRQEFGEDFVIVTPGIRPLGSDAGDQQRIATPEQAVSNGSNFLVVGRPIVQAADPQSAAIKILEEIENVPCSG